MLDDVPQRGRNVRGGVGERSAVAIQDLLHRLDVVRPIEGANPGDCFK